MISISWKKSDHDKGYEDKDQGLYIRRLWENREWVVILMHQHSPEGYRYAAHLGKKPSFDTAEREIVRLLALIRRGLTEKWSPTRIVDEMEEIYDPTDSNFYSVFTAESLVVESGPNT